MAKKSKAEIKLSHVWQAKNGKKILIDFYDENSVTPINGCYAKDGTFNDRTIPKNDLIKYSHTDKKHLKKRREKEKESS